MILFIANAENDPTKFLYDLIKEETNIPVFWLSVENLVKKGSFTVKNEGENLNFTIKINDETIDSKAIKIIFLYQPPLFDKSWLSFKEELDISYAQQEWYASFNAMMLAQKHIKFINPVFCKFDLNSRLEQILILQQFGFKTVNIILTNDGKTALEYYNLCDRSVISRPVNHSYPVEYLMQIPDLARLNKLYLCPVLFQKFIPGKKINVCLVGNKVLAQEISFNSNNEICQKNTEIPEDIKNKLIEVSKYLEFPWIFYEFIISDKDNEYYAISLNVVPDFNLMNELYGNLFIEAIREYLTEEYAQ